MASAVAFIAGYVHWRSAKRYHVMTYSENALRVLAQNTSLSSSFLPLFLTITQSTKPLTKFSSLQSAHNWKWNALSLPPTLSSPTTEAHPRDSLPKSLKKQSTHQATHLPHSSPFSHCPIWGCSLRTLVWPARPVLSPRSRPSLTARSHMGNLRIWCQSSRAASSLGLVKRVVRGRWVIGT